MIGIDWADGGAITYTPSEDGGGVAHGGRKGEQGKDVNLTTELQLAFTVEEIWRIFTLSSNGIRHAAGPPEVPAGRQMLE